MAKKRHYASKPNPHVPASGPMPNVVSHMRGMEGYSDRNQSRKMMARDGAMIHEDHMAPALLPQRVIDSYWPDARNHNMGYVEDLFYGVQKQMHEDYDDLSKEMFPKKY